MAQVKQGQILGAALQPNHSLTYKDDGSIEGSLVYRIDASAASLLPKIGSHHPRDSRLELYAREIVYLANSLVEMRGSYFGIESRKTDPVVSSTTNADRLPIELHPDFADLAGTGDAPLNGAKWDLDADTGAYVFDRFNGGDDDELELFGTEMFFSASVQVSLSYWTRDAPKLETLMTIYKNVPGYEKPAGVKDFLLIGMPTRQVGSHYQVTVQMLGSGPGGWNPSIYEQASGTIAGLSTGTLTTGRL